MATKKKKKVGKRIDFLNIHKGFTDNMKSLEVFVDNIAPVAKRLDRTEFKEADKLGKEIIRFVLGAKRVSKEKLEKFEIDAEGVMKLIKDKDKADVMYKFLKKVTRISLSQAQLLYRGAFVMLMSYFDFLLSDLIRCFYEKYPENLSKEESPSLTLSELNLSNTIDDAIDLIISKEVEKVLRKRLKEQKFYLRDRLKIDIKDNIINWGKIVESMERRHVIVHSNCKINKRYLSSVDLSQAPEKNKDLKEGKTTIITEDYFKSVFGEIIIAGLVLIQLCWRKWEKDDEDNVDRQIIAEIYDLLVKENWEWAERLGLFSRECDVTNPAYRLMLDINYCQSLKWQGKADELQKELTKYDISTMSPKFALGICALRSDRDGFYQNIGNAITMDKMTKDKMTKTDFMEWPLFRELREDSDYEERIDSALKSISNKHNE